MKKIYIISLFTLSSFLTGCYTQLATRDYEKEDFGVEGEEAALSDVQYYDTLFAESDTLSYDTVYVDEDTEIYDNLYADYPVSDNVVYPEIIYVGGGYYYPYRDYWYYPWYSYYPGCLTPGYWPYWYPGYCSISFHYYDSYYDPYYYGGYYGYATSDPKYKYRTNTTHDERIRDNDGERTTSRTRTGLGGTGMVGRTASITNRGSSIGKSRSINVDNEIGKSRGSAPIKTVKKDPISSKSRDSRVLIASRNSGLQDSRNARQVKGETKKTSIKNKTYGGSRTKIITRSKSDSRTNAGKSTKVYRPTKKTSSGSNEVKRTYRSSTKSGKSTSGKSYNANRSRTSSKSYSAPKSSGRSSSSKSYSSPSRGSSSSRSSYSPRSSGSSSRSSASRSGSSRSSSSSSGRSSGKSRR